MPHLSPMSWMFMLLSSFLLLTTLMMNISYLNNTSLNIITLNHKWPKNQQNWSWFQDYHKL